MLKELGKIILQAEIHEQNPIESSLPSPSPEVVNVNIPDEKPSEIVDYEEPPLPADDISYEALEVSLIDNNPPHIDLIKEDRGSKDLMKSEGSTLLTLETDRYLKIIPEEENGEEIKTPEEEQEEIKHEMSTVSSIPSTALPSNAGVRKTGSIERGSKNSLIMMKQLGKRIDDDTMPEIIISEVSEPPEEQDQDEEED